MEDIAEILKQKNEEVPIMVSGTVELGRNAKAVIEKLKSPILLVSYRPKNPSVEPLSTISPQRLRQFLRRLAMQESQLLRSSFLHLLRIRDGTWTNH